MREEKSELLRKKIDTKSEIACLCFHTMTTHWYQLSGVKIASDIQKKIEKRMCGKE